MNELTKEQLISCLKKAFASYSILNELQVKIAYSLVNEVDLSKGSNLPSKLEEMKAAEEQILFELLLGNKE